VTYAAHRSLAWRRQFDSAAAAGVPAHVTIIYPFLPQQDINEEVMGNLRRLIADHPSFIVTFAQCGEFPDVLFLVPDPDDPFRRLTAEMVQRWPEAPPYAGLITDPIPHLTITHGAPANKGRPGPGGCDRPPAFHLPYPAGVAYQV
jgi:2'-5' RNA ligase